VWAEVMGFLHRREPSRAPSPPPGVVQTKVTFGAGADGGPLEAARSEWFLNGTEQSLFAVEPAAGSGMAAARITAPADGTILALDPDIPPERQRVRFEATGRAVRWRMDGKPFSRENSVKWLPWPGRHVVQLTDAQGTVLDEIRLEVRGAGVKAGSAVNPGMARRQ